MYVLELCSSSKYHYGYRLAHCSSFIYLGIVCGAFPIPTVLTPSLFDLQLSSQPIKEREVLKLDKDWDLHGLTDIQENPGSKKRKQFLKGLARTSKKKSKTEKPVASTKKLKTKDLNSTEGAAVQDDTISKDQGKSLGTKKEEDIAKPVVVPLTSDKKKLVEGENESAAKSKGFEENNSKQPTWHL
ncbi:hypothetical protein R1flu_028656 [Riccia fluitans]|uniref:Uncharacterized protein n=1 Tax=Riccia fluitans TaxID=41844 RepID=A0ABD1XMZ9_9MARC